MGPGRSTKQRWMSGWIWTVRHACQCIHSDTRIWTRDPEGLKPATKGGWMGADQNFCRIWSVGLYLENHHKPSNLGWESSYGLAISKKKTLERETEAIRENSTNSSSAKSDRSDRYLRPVRPVGLEIEIPDRSDRLPRPVRPVAPRQPATKASKCKSRANEV